MNVVRVSIAGGAAVRVSEKTTSIVGINSTGYASGRLEVNGPGVVVGVKDTYDNRVTANRRVLVNVSRAAVVSQQNIIVAGLLEGDMVSHNLDSMFLAGRFFSSVGREIKDMDFECVDSGRIKIYLPLTDNEVVDSFTGEILLERRR